MQTVQTMETNDVVQSAPAIAPAQPDAQPRRRGRARRVRRGSMRGLAFDKIGAVYVWLGIVVVFSIWVPDTFPTIATVKQVLNANAITALAALSITIPLAARVFDLSFAYTMTLTGVITAHFVSVGVPLVPALAARARRRRADRRHQRGRRRRDADRLVHRHARDRAR